MIRNRSKYSGLLLLSWWMREAKTSAVVLCLVFHLKLYKMYQGSESGVSKNRWHARLDKLISCSIANAASIDTKVCNISTEIAYRIFKSTATSHHFINEVVLLHPPQYP